VGSIPDVVIGFSIDLIPPTALQSWGSNQSLTEMSTRNLSGGKGWTAREADVTAICEPIV
jgi:hypothetical protein